MGYYDNYNNSSTRYSGRYGYGSYNYDPYDDFDIGYRRSTKKEYTRRQTDYDFNFWSGYSYKAEDDDSELITVDCEQYLTPKREDIISKVGKGRISEKETNLIKDMSRMFYHQMMEEPKYILDESEVDPNNMENYQFTKPILEGLWDKDIPGFTPLEKAILCYLEILKNNKDLENMSESQIKQNVEGIRIDKETFYDQDYLQQIDSLNFTKKFKSSLLRKISFIKNFGSKFKIEKEVEEKIVTNSAILAPKRMTAYEQIQYVSLYQRMLPNFMLKFARKDLNVNIPVDRTEHKQKIIILVDESGSMSDDEKQLWVCALMMERMKHVILGEAEIYFSYFVCGIHGFHHIKDEKDVMYFWSKIYNQRPPGGTTYIGDIIPEIKKNIESKSFYNLGLDLSEERPEILIINDGQDRIGTKQFPYKCNAVTLMEDNRELRQLCVDNNGKYVHIQYGDIIKEYEK